jgi:hypothetical protein
MCIRLLTFPIHVFPLASLPEQSEQQFADQAVLEPGNLATAELDSALPLANWLYPHDVHGI